MKAARRRMTAEERAERDRQALNRAQSTTSIANGLIVITTFQARGLSDVRPGENVLTFNAWKALGRHVRKGEHGVKLTVWAPTRDEETGEERRRPFTSVVFHESQTDANDPRPPKAWTQPAEPEREQQERDGEIADLFGGDR